MVQIKSLEAKKKKKKRKKKNFPHIFGILFNIVPLLIKRMMSCGTVLLEVGIASIPSSLLHIHTLPINTKLKHTQRDQQKENTMGILAPISGAEAAADKEKGGALVQSTAELDAGALFVLKSRG